MDPSVRCFSIIAVLLFCCLQYWIAFRCDMMNGIHISIVEWNANGTGIRGRSLFVFSGCSSIFRFPYDSARLNATETQDSSSPFSSVIPLVAQEPIQSPIGYTMTLEPETPIPFSQPTVVGNRSHLNSYERSLLEKTKLRKSFLKKWIVDTMKLQKNSLI